MSRHGSKKPSEPPVVHYTTDAKGPICGAKQGTSVMFGADAVTCSKCQHLLTTRKYRFK